MCVLFLSTTCIGNINHSKKNSERYYHKCTYAGLHVNFPLLLSDFNRIWIFSTDFRKISKYKISWKSVLWEWNFSTKADRRADGRTDRQTDRQAGRQLEGHDESHSRFSQFCKHAYWKPNTITLTILCMFHQNLSIKLVLKMIQIKERTVIKIAE